MEVFKCQQFQININIINISSSHNSWYYLLCIPINKRFLGEILSNDIDSHLQRLDVIRQVGWIFLTKNLVISKTPKNFICFLTFKNIIYHQSIPAGFVQSLCLTFQIRYNDFVKKLVWFFVITVVFLIRV